jgi:hypothetical protein
MCNRAILIITSFACIGLMSRTLPLRGQVTPEEHASHHPDQAGAASQHTTSPAGKSGGMMDGMGEMMKMMGGTPPQKELYPSLMALPELSPEQRKQVAQQAGERMYAGATLMGQALDTLNGGTQSGDYAAMQEAMTRLREGAAQLESGIAARRALSEGRAPQEIALAWFKREMNLPLGAAPAAHQSSGVTLFHLFTMVLLIAFALAMLAMYFFKMRRAAALFGRIEPDAAAPPPGSAKPLPGPPAADAKPAPAEAKST